MASKMLIDAAHPEETRVVVLRGGRVEEFDFESAARKLLRGNIYLAKVTRVEPSLQAAFVEYGADRHGFLPLKEVSPTLFLNKPADGQRTEIKEVLKEGQEIVVQVVDGVAGIEKDGQAPFVIKVVLIFDAAGQQVPAAQYIAVFVLWTERFVGITAYALRTTREKPDRGRQSFP